MEKECNTTHEAKHFIKLAIALALPLAGFIISNLTAPNRRKPTKRTTTNRTGSPTSREEEDMTSSPTCTSHSLFSDDDDGRPQSPDSAPSHCEEQEQAEPSRSMPSAGDAEAFRVQQPGNSDVVSIFQHREEGPGLEEEIEGLKRVVACLEDGQSELESQFREYVNVTEEETWYQRLQIMYLGFKLEVMEARNQKTEATIANYQKTVAKLDKVRAETRLLGRKVKKLSKSSGRHSATIRGHDFALRDGETELWRSIEELKQVKQDIRELDDRIREGRKATERLLQMQTTTTTTRTPPYPSISKGEEEAMQGDKASMKRLREREFMDQQLQLFQHRWYAEMEELIYLGWLGASLRHEMLKMHRGEEEDAEEEGDRPKLIPVQEVKDQLIMELPANCKAKDCRNELHGSGGSSPVAEFAVANQMEIAATREHTAAAPKKQRLLRKIKRWARAKGKEKSPYLQ